MVQCHELNSRLEKLEHDQHYNPTAWNRYNGIQRYVSAINPRYHHLSRYHPI